MRKTLEENQLGRSHLSTTKAVLAGALAASLVVGMGVLAACSPQAPASDTKADAPVAQAEPEGNGADNAAAAEDTASKEDGAKDAAGSTGMNMTFNDFTDCDPGLFEGASSQEIYQNTFWVNDGNRGCNACHEDLWDTTNNISSLSFHMAASDPGYGKNANIRDCLGCHHGTNASGPWIRDLIHNRHYGSKMFVEEQNGNCMSCHAINIAGEFVMYDYYKYSREFGGFPNAGNPDTQEWLVGRGWSNGSMSGIVTQANMPLTATYDHDPSNKDDRFWASNVAVPEVDASKWTLKVTGVKNPREFTYEELKAMPQTERVAGIPCGANTIGSYQVHNAPIKGVLLTDIIEACGGLEDGKVSLDWQTEDNWHWPKGATYDLQALIDAGGMVVLEYWNEPLRAVDGYPASLGWPGRMGGFYMKWLTEINFSDQPGTTGLWDILKDGPAGAYPTDKPGDVVHRDSGGAINSGWINPSNDGAEFKLGEPVKLEGYSYVWVEGDHFVDKVQFSADYGNTWTEVDIDDDYDHASWTHWTIEWQPEQAGTYVLYSNTVDGTGQCQMSPSPIIVKIVE